MTSALVPLAPGVEEMEAVIIIDVLRRAGWKVVSAGLVRDVIVASRGVRLVPDTFWKDVDPNDFDWLILPGGGPGVKALCAEPGILDWVRRFVRTGKRVGAICAAPLVLQAAGVLDGRQATCHPAEEKRLTHARLKDARVVTDGPITTSRAAGTALEFALDLVRQTDGDATIAKIVEGLAL